MSSVLSTSTVGVENAVPSVPSTKSGGIGNEVLSSRIMVQLNMTLKSPFLVKRHLFFSRPDPGILGELYKLATVTNDPESIQKVWATRRDHPLLPVELKLRDIQRAVKLGGQMDNFCLDIAVGNMIREDAENFKNTKCLGWRHYVYSDWMQLIDKATNVRDYYSRESALKYDAFGSHLVFIPVHIQHSQHWALYAFDMYNRKLSILDSLPDAMEGGQDPKTRHDEIRKKVCNALNIILNFELNFLYWEYEFPKVPRQKNNLDCGFFVFNFMRLWDGHRLIRSFSTETMELRKDFLAYLLCKYKDAAHLPSDVSYWIKKYHESELPSTSTAGIANAVPTITSTKITVQPNKELKSPFSVKRHLFFSRPDPDILNELYELATVTNDPESIQKVWATKRDHPLGTIELKLRDIQEAVKPRGQMENFCLDLAVGNMIREDAENFKNTKCLGWRHYVYSDWMQLIDDTRNLRVYYSGKSALEYDAFGSHLVFIPIHIQHSKHWTLYAFDMYNRKLSILDPLPDATEGGQDPRTRHEGIRKEVCDALTKTTDFSVNFLSWECEFPKVPRQQNSFDSGFFVFNFMRLWDGHQLIRWFSTETKELRKDFLAYILCKYNDADDRPYVSKLIKKFPGEAIGDAELLRAANRGNADAFRKLLDPVGKRDDSSIPTSGRWSCFHFECRSPCSCSCFAFEYTPSRHAVEQDNKKKQDDVCGDYKRLLTFDGDGDGVLHIAARFGHVELAKVILEMQNTALKAAVVQARNNRGDTPLHCAAATGSIAMVQLIIDYTDAADRTRLVRAKNLAGQTCLHEAVRHGHKDVVEHLLKQDENFNDQSSLLLVQIVDNKGVSPLYLAITSCRGSTAVVKKIIERAPSDKPGAASYSGPEGETALHAAADLSQELTKMLLEWNSNLIKIPDEFGTTPLHRLARYNLTPSFFSMGLWRNTDLPKLSYIDKLLDEDPSSLYGADQEGSLPLHIAAAYGSMGIFRQLIENSPGCELSCNGSGQTILHVAAERGRYHIVHYVCSKKRFKTILNSKDNDGNTALHFAVQKGYGRTCRYLMKFRDVELSIRNNKGHTPLDLAVQNSRKSGPTIWPAWIRNILVFAGADLGAFLEGDTTGMTPEPDRAGAEALSEKLTKLAAIMVTFTALIFNAALIIFNSVVAINNTNIANISHESKKTQQLKELCGSSLLASAEAIILFAVAGFPILTANWFRIGSLTVGLVMLSTSFTLALLALVARMDLANVSLGFMGIFAYLAMPYGFFMISVVLTILVTREVIFAVRIVIIRNPFALLLRCLKHPSQITPVPFFQVAMCVAFLILSSTIITVSI